MLIRKWGLIIKGSLILINLVLRKGLGLLKGALKRAELGREKLICRWGLSEGGAYQRLASIWERKGR